MSTQTQAFQQQSGPESLGETIDRLLSETGRKTYWVAAQMGMAEGTFRAIRTGKRVLKPAEAERLAALFNLPVSTFIPEPEQQ